MKGKRYILYTLIFLTAVCSAAVLGGCNRGGSEDGTVTVTFRASGEEDIVRTTEYGGSIIPPSVPSKVGNDGWWETEEFDEVKQDMTDCSRTGSRLSLHLSVV